MTTESRYTFHADGLGIDLQAIGATEKEAYAKAWASLTDEQKDRVEILDCVDEVKLPERTMMGECYTCKHHRESPGDAHIRCNKPDPGMVGEPHGIRMGWFYYPMLYDPVWKRKMCDNYEPTGSAA